MPIRKVTIVDSNGATRQIEVDHDRYNQIAAGLQYTQIAGEIKDRYRHSANDAGEAMSFLVSQLAYVENQVFEKMRIPMQYEKLIPISFEAGEYATSIDYEVYDYAGRGKRSSGRMRDINTVDVAWARKSMPVVNGDVGYEYTQEEMRQSAFLKRSLDSRKLGAAVDAYKRHMNDVGLNGELNLPGIINNSLVPQGNAPTGTWGSATPANILKDINAGILLVWTNTAYNDQVTTIALAPSAYNYIATTPRSDNSDKTILQFLKENNIAKVEKGIDIEFVPIIGLETGGSGSTRRMMLYVKNPQRVIMHIPMAQRFLAPQMFGLSVQIPGEYKYSGVEFRYPKSAYYMDNI